MKVYPLTVIGGGAAGVMATLRSVLNNDETLFFPGSPKDKKRSRALWVGKIENIPGMLGYKKGIENPNRETLEFLEKGPFTKKLHWKKNIGVSDIKKNADGVFEVTDSNGDKYLSEYIILATGVMDVQPEIEGDITRIFPYANTQLIDYCIRCDGHHVLGKETSIIGHGNGAAWVAVMLHERYGVSMSIMTHGKEPEFDTDVKKLLNLYKIEVYKDEIVDLRGDPTKGSFKGFILKSGNFVDSEFAFVSLGMMVYNKLSTGLDVELDERGFVKTNTKGESSIHKFYVAGDLRANTKKQVYTAWDTAVDSADDINAKIRRARREQLLKKGGFHV